MAAEAPPSVAPDEKEARIYIYIYIYIYVAGTFTYNVTCLLWYISGRVYVITYSTHSRTHTHTTHLCRHAHTHTPSHENPFTKFASMKEIKNLGE